MPLHVFLCDGCGERFEDLVRPQDVPACPRCGGERLHKAPPRVAVRVAAPAAARPGPCGTCGDPRGLGACEAG